jgi:HK97 family phage major capsid protein
MSEREMQLYSFLNAIRALQNPEDKKAQEAAALEREASQAAITGTGQNSRSGMVVPVDVLLHSGSRAMNASSAGGNGAALIATELLHGSFIEMFQKKCFLMNVGTRLTGLVGNVAIPKQLSGATAYVVGVEEAPTASKGSFGQVPLDPKTIGTLVELERLFTKQSSIDAEALIRKMIADAMAYKLNHLALYADGSAKMPTGLKYIPGINAVSFATAGKPTFKEFVQLETEIAADDADVESMRYLLNARTRGYCKTAQKMDGTADSATIWENNGTVNGYQTITTNHVDPNDIFFGNFSDMLLGMWGGLDLTVDTTTKCDTGITRLVAFQDFDIAVRNAESFCVGTTA